MPTFLPALGSCRSRMQTGERRFAERLARALPDDSLIWYDVPVGPASLHPDFLILDPRRGALVIEVKDWKRETVLGGDKFLFRIRAGGAEKRVASPLEQARQYAHAVADLLKADPALLLRDGPRAGELAFPWSYGTALTGLSRKELAEDGLDRLLEPARVVCKDEMTEAEDPARLRERLWGMFHHACREPLTPAQVDRIRYHVFPEVRIARSQLVLFKEEEADTPRVMDLQQEQLARSLGEGHRVIHGVAGSGKTLILTYRAAQLAAACAKPILVLCYNRTLAVWLKRRLEAMKAGKKVEVRTFHQWCRSQLVARAVALPPHDKDSDAWCRALVARTAQALETGRLPRGQYGAVLVDEGHDFEPEWLRLAVSMAEPAANSVLVLFDDAQSIYAKDHKRKFSFKSAGIQAAGRTTILRVNYRNTREILELARARARDLLTAKDSDEDGAPVVAPVAAGRHGAEPEVWRGSPAEEGAFIAARFKAAHEAGRAWGSMAVIARYERVGKGVLSALREKGIPALYQSEAGFGDGEDAVRLLTMHSCKGLEFPLVAIPGAGRVETRLLYVAMTRATEELVVCEGGTH